MFSQLLFVRLKAAENALRDGRLDEAYRLAMTPDIREHRRGAAVLAAAAEQFIERARNHYRADRFEDALSDLAKARGADVKIEEIAELREQIRVVAAEKTLRDETRRRRIDAAMHRVADGSLAAGRQILQDASDHNPQARRVKEQLDARADDVEQTIAQAERHMAEGQLAEAAERVRRAKSIDAHHERLAALESRLCAIVCEKANDAIAAGRLARACDELARLNDLGMATPRRRELADMLLAARSAADCVQAGRYADARPHAMTLQRLLPGADWVEQVIEQLRQIDDVRTALRAGPLGDRITIATPSPDASPPTPMERRDRSLDDTVAFAPSVAAAGGLPDRLLLLLDGGGSYLVLRNGRASIGRAASESPADVPVFSDLAERHADISRVDDDYFLYSSRDVEIGGRATRQHLLRDGERMTLGRKAKFTFRKPSRKSSTAVLDLSDTTKMPNDVRRVVLFEKHATIGAGPTAHMRCRHASPALVLFERDGALWIRVKNDGHVDTEARALRLGEPMEIAGVSIVVEPWRVRTPGTSHV